MGDPFERLSDPSPRATPDPAFAEALRARLRQAARESWRTNMSEPGYRTGKICYLEIPAVDVAQSAEFYRRCFGWHIRQRGDGSTAFDDTVGQVSGTWVLGRAPSSEAGLLVYIMVADAEKAAKAVVAAGGAIVQPVDPRSSEVHLTFRDLAGNVLGIYQQRGLAEAEGR